MCTVTFIPQGNNQFILTSNRDEKKGRKPALPPRKFIQQGDGLFYPKDQEAGGTWIAYAVNGFTLCLLNGAFEKHVSTGPYARSRGVVLLDFFNYKNVEDYVANYSFVNIEPFTLVIVESAEELKLHELVWDGNILNHNQKDSSVPHIWSSVTLYDETWRLERKNKFMNWLATQHEVNMDAIIGIHEGLDERMDGPGLRMPERITEVEKANMLTVSITSINRSEEGVCLKYKDIVSQEMVSLRIL